MNTNELVLPVAIVAIVAVTIASLRINPGTTSIPRGTVAAGGVTLVAALAMWRADSGYTWAVLALAAAVLIVVGLLEAPWRRPRAAATPSPEWVLPSLQAMVTARRELKEAREGHSCADVAKRGAEVQAQSAEAARGRVLESLKKVRGAAGSLAEAALKQEENEAKSAASDARRAADGSETQATIAANAARRAHDAARSCAATRPDPAIVSEVSREAAGVAHEASAEAARLAESAADDAKTATAAAKRASVAAKEAEDAANEAGQFVRASRIKT